MANEFPELNQEEWGQVYTAASAQGQQGLIRALHLTVTGIANSRSQIGTQVGYLKSEIGKLNSNLETFNRSSDNLTRKALNLTTWIMVSALVSATATGVLAVDVILKWIH